MNTILSFAFLALFTSSLTFGQVQNKSGINQNSKVEKELVQIEQELADSLVRGDVAPYERYYADACTFTGTQGEVLNKAGLMAFLKDLKYETFTFDETKVQVYGNTAVVTFRSTEKLSYKGGPAFSGHNRWMDVFVRQGGRWQIVAEQGTVVKQ